MKSWRQSTDEALACFLAAYQFKPLNIHSGWYTQGGEAQKKIINRWFNRACYRLSQVGEWHVHEYSLVCCVAQYQVQCTVWHCFVLSWFSRIK